METGKSKETGGGESTARRARGTDGDIARERTLDVNASDDNPPRGSTRPRKAVTKLGGVMIRHL